MNLPPVMAAGTQRFPPTWIDVCTTPVHAVTRSELQMKAWQVSTKGARVLEAVDRAALAAGADDLLIDVLACGVCRTDLHLVDGELPQARFPIVPGHEVVGRIVACGSRVTGFAVGDRVGVPWLASTCGVCPFCTAGRENLCAEARFTGCHVDGGYAEQTIARADACLRIPERYDDVHAAPLMCAGLIGYRAYRMAGPASRLGLYGFGAAAHLVAQMARHEGREVLAFVAPGDDAALRFARAVGVSWAGYSDGPGPSPLDAAIIFAPVGKLVPEALSRLVPGGTVVCAGIHMSDIPSFPYRLLWQERLIRSVANLTRRDGTDFMALAATLPLETTVSTYDMDAANQALDDLRSGRVSGAAVLRPARNIRASAG